MSRRIKGKVDDAHVEVAVKGEATFDFDSNFSKFDKDSFMEGEMAKMDIGQGGGGGGMLGAAADGADAPRVPSALPTGPVGSAEGTDNTLQGFFDTISCDATDREGGQRMTGAERRREEAEMNVDTFGAVALNDNRRQRYRGGGKGGKGRGGGKGGKGGKGGRNR